MWKKPYYPETLSHRYFIGQCNTKLGLPITRGVNQNPTFRNSEIVRIPIRHSDGQHLILSDNVGQTKLLNNPFLDKLVNVMLIKKKTLVMSRLNIWSVHKNGPKVMWYTWFSVTLYCFHILLLLKEQIIVTVPILNQQSSKRGGEDTGHHP